MLGIQNRTVFCQLWNERYRQVTYTSSMTKLGMLKFAVYLWDYIEFDSPYIAAHIYYSYIQHDTYIHDLCGHTVHTNSIIDVGAL